MHSISVRQDALRHFEVGFRIGELSLDPDFDDLLPWGYIRQPTVPAVHEGVRSVPVAVEPVRRSGAHLRPDALAQSQRQPGGALPVSRKSGEDGLGKNVASEADLPPPRSSRHPPRSTIRQRSRPRKPRPARPRQPALELEHRHVELDRTVSVLTQRGRPLAAAACAAAGFYERHRGKAQRTRSLSPRSRFCIRACRRGSSSVNDATKRPRRPSSSRRRGSIASSVGKIRLGQLGGRRCAGLEQCAPGAPGTHDAGAACPRGRR